MLCTENCPICGHLWDHITLDGLDTDRWTCVGSGFYFGTPSNLGHPFSLVSCPFSFILGTFVKQVDVRGHTILDLDGPFRSQVIPDFSERLRFSNLGRISSIVGR